MILTEGRNLRCLSLLAYTNDFLLWVVASRLSDYIQANDILSEDQ